ncbi:hypothetical protein VXQ18_08680 [Brucella abortus]|nr:hypothetical protein [Brucella abortus]
MIWASSVRGAVEKGLLVKGGGHAMAAGITIERGNLGCAARSSGRRSRGYRASRLRENQSLSIDGALAASGATVALYEALQKAGPYGSAHPQPSLALPHHVLADVRGVEADHVRCTLRVGRFHSGSHAIAFRAAKAILDASCSAISAAVCMWPEIFLSTIGMFLFLPKSRFWMRLCLFKKLHGFI